MNFLKFGCGLENFMALLHPVCVDVLCKSNSIIKVIIEILIYFWDGR